MSEKAKKVVRCRKKSPQRIPGLKPMTCGLRKGHVGHHMALGWAIPDERLPAADVDLSSDGDRI